jgi:hypothetical protein
MLSDSIKLAAARVYAAPETLRDFETRVAATLRALRQFDAAFGTFEVLHRDEYRPVDAELGDLGSLITASIMAGGRAGDFRDVAADGSLLSDSTNVLGFGASLRAQPRNGSPARTPGQSIILSFHGASPGMFTFSQTRMELPVIEPWTETATLRALLSTLFEVSRANSGQVYRAGFDYQMRRLSPDRSGADWMLYVARPSVTACLPASFAREPFAGGELIHLSPHMPDPDNPTDIETAFNARAALAELGLFRWATYVIHGWKPDAEETRYEQAISGAPVDRKYTVHCVDFDGYDAERKVLLYAKLFRELRVTPRAWGLRGLDEPVLNEARRQVRAAARAGGVPIEWHIGLEEPAQRAAELLADYGGIPPSQIQVFHTPFENILPPHPDGVRET